MEKIHNARIAYLSVTGQLGGAEIALLNLLRGLGSRGSGFDLHVILGEAGPLAGMMEDIGVSVHHLPLPRVLRSLGECGPKSLLTLVAGISGLAAAVSYWLKLRKLLGTINPQIVHSNGIKAHLFSAITAQVDRPVVWHMHDYLGLRGTTCHLLRWMSRRIRAIVTNSFDVQLDLVRAGMQCCDLTTIYNGIDTHKLSANRETVDLDLLSGMPPAGADVVRIGLVGTFAKWKGHAVFLQALSRLRTSIPLRAYIIGGPIYQTNGSQFSMAELKNMALDLAVADNVGFTGFLRDPAAAIRSLDVVIHASTKPEPFGMIIAEALCCGKAVVASRAGGAQEIFVEGKSALAHTPGNAQELADCIQLLVNDPDVRQRLGAAGAATVNQRFTLDQCAMEMTRLYGRLLDVHAAKSNERSSSVRSPAVAER